MKSKLQSLFAHPEGHGWRGILVRSVLAVLLAGGARLFFIWAGSHREWVEQVYALRIYPVIAHGLSSLNGFLPFSLAEMLLYAVILAALVMVVLLVIRMIRAHYPVWRFTRFVSILLLIAGLGYLLFYAAWGLTYERMPLASSLNYTVEPTDSSILKDMAVELVRETNAAAEKTERNSDGTMRLSSSMHDTLKGAREAWEALGKELELVPKYRYAAPKPVAASELLCYTEITGIYIPFTAEANINIAVPVCTIPSSAAHESAHLRGFAREDEANYLAYRACKASGNPDYRYSGYLLAAIHTLNALYKADRDGWKEAFGMLSEDVRADLNENNRFWKQYEGPVAEQSNKTNDAYLKSNSQKTGVASYGQMVDLMIAEYKVKHGIS